MPSLPTLRCPRQIPPSPGLELLLKRTGNPVTRCMCTSRHVEAMAISGSTPRAATRNRQGHLCHAGHHCLPLPGGGRPAETCATDAQAARTRSMGARPPGCRTARGGDSDRRSVDKKSPSLYISRSYMPSLTSHPDFPMSVLRAKEREKKKPGQCFPIAESGK